MAYDDSMTEDEMLAHLRRRAIAAADELVALLERNPAIGDTRLRLIASVYREARNQ